MTTNGYHADGSFPLRHMALKKPAIVRGPEDTFVYATKGTDIDMARLVYFCISVFWRSGAHTWRLGKDTFHLELGPYEEALRLFLRGKGSLPDDMCLIVRMASVGYFGRTLALPVSEKHDAFRGHHFSALGISANLYVGKRIPEYFWLQSAFPMALLTINKHFDNKQLGLVVEHVMKKYPHLKKREG